MPSSGIKITVCLLLVRKAERMRQLAIPNSNWTDNIKMHFGEVRLCDVDWTDLA
jgi:hypothetical protein